MSTNPDFGATFGDSAPQKPAPTMNVVRRAATAARIFDILATVVLVFGGLLVVGQLVGGIAFVIASADSGSESESGLGSGITVLLGLAGTFFGVILTAIVTAINWAVITLATAVAGYIAQRSRESSPA